MDINMVSLYTKKYIDIYTDIADIVGARFDASNLELDRPLPKVKKR